MTETAIVAIVGLVGILLAPVVQEMIVHRKQRRYRLAAMRRAPYARWLRAGRRFLMFPLKVAQRKRLEDASYLAILYASDKPRLSIEAYLRVIHDFWKVAGKGIEAMTEPPTYAELMVVGIQLGPVVDRVLRGGGGRDPAALGDLRVCEHGAKPL